MFETYMLTLNYFLTVFNSNKELWSAVLSGVLSLLGSIIALFGALYISKDSVKRTLKLDIKEKKRRELNKLLNLLTLNLNIIDHAKSELETHLKRIAEDGSYQPRLNLREMIFDPSILSEELNEIEVNFFTYTLNLIDYYNKNIEQFKLWSERSHEFIHIHMDKGTIEAERERRREKESYNQVFKIYAETTFQIINNNSDQFKKTVAVLKVLLNSSFMEGNPSSDEIETKIKEEETMSEIIEKTPKKEFL